jgi:hypothetical protein
MLSYRNGHLDYAKLLAACGILWFHTGAPGASYGYAGLGFFFIVLVLFTVPGALGLRPVDFAKHRALRLLVPWVICCFLYSGVKLIEVLSTPRTFADEFAAWMVFTGPALHLWFLPFAFVVSLFIYPFIRYATAAYQIARYPLAFCFGMLTLISLSLPLPQGTPWAQWTYALPSICFGLFVVFSGANTLQILGTAAGFGVVSLAAGWPGAPQLLLAIALLLWAFTIPFQATALSAKAARVALLVYLLHPFIAALLRRMTTVPDDSVSFASLLLVMTLITCAALDTMWRAARSGHGLQRQLHRA